MAQLDRTIKVFPDLESATAAAAELVLPLISESVRERGRFTAALAGGNTPSGLYRTLGGAAFSEQIPWRDVLLYFGDERCVPPDDPESNYGMVRRTLLAQAPIPAENVHRIQGERQPSEAAAAYDQEIRSSLGLKPGELPRFDLILLGMGPDGHTASLFPFTVALAVRDRLVVANPVLQLNTERITLTLPVLNNAAVVIFLLSGEDKAEALSAVLEGSRDPGRYPAQSVEPEHGRVVWLIDRAAASNLGPPFV